ncbi:MAG: UvrD-helicase domain-containing protein [Planctomycetota bacterium]|nr:UvrD-helicase domain-containing protein [Planctomycetota bacterium]
MTRRLQLTPAQHAAAIDRVGDNLALLSGAGCGKTHVLARRFTELLMRSGDEANPLSRFVALTFTDKAALEMSKSVHKLLAEAARGSKGHDRRRLLGWLEQLPEARISTIHAFCASTLRAYAVEAGLDPAFAVCAEELIQEQMISEAAEQAVLAAVEAEDANVAKLLSCIPFNAAVGQVRQLLEMRTLFDFSAFENPAATLARWCKLYDAERQAAFDRLQNDADLRDQLNAVSAAPCGDDNDKLNIYRRERLPIAERIIASRDARTAADFAILGKKPGTIGSGKNWGGAASLKHIRREMKDLFTSLGEYGVYAEQFGELDVQAAEMLSALTYLAGRANELYAATKRRRGLLDFLDLLDHTYKLLAGNAAVRGLLAEQIDQLLIDETQDTNGFQLRLLSLLIFGREDPPNPPDGRLFIVGDGKQSIYRFRGAEVEQFERVCRRLGRNRQETLDVSFRTHPAGVAFVNHLFEPLMGDDYTPISSSRSETPPQPAVEILLAGASDDFPIDSAAGATAAQAALTAQRIRQMLDNKEPLVRDEHGKAWRPVQPGDIAILFARATYSLDYENELARRSVPSYMVAGSGFFQQQEVYDILNALRVIDNPFDDVAFFGVLRSSLFGLDDNALMWIAETLKPPYLPKLVENPSSAVDGLTEAHRETLMFATGLLLALHREKDAVGIDVLIERLLEETGYSATLLAQFRGKRMLGNVRRLIEQAHSATAGLSSLAEFIRRMDEMVISDSSYSQAVVVGETENVVRLMTIHKAKGLEFPVVFIPDLNAGRKGHKGALLHRDDWRLTYKLKADDADDESQGLPLSYRLAKRLENADQQAEDIRKLYVAATRHRDHLVFVGADWRTQDGGFRASNSYLQTLDQQLGLAKGLNAGRQSIPYGRDGYELRLLAVQPKPARRRKTTLSPGKQLLADAASGEDLARRIIASASGGKAAWPLIGPLPVSIGRAELAVTALADFEHCPMLYRWRYELRIPAEYGKTAAAQKAEAKSAHLPDAATMGTIFHRCMELLDFAQPRAETSLVQQVVGEMDLQEAVDVEAVAAELASMLANFRSHKLWPQLVSARCMLRELDFVMDCGAVSLHGQIDLLFQDADGAWRIVDYKSDCISADRGAIQRHAGRYELQMLVYAIAAGRHLGHPPAEAMLYFLRPAVTHAFNVTETALKAAEKRAETLAEELVAARRVRQFTRRETDACELCSYQAYCLRQESL